MLNKYSKQKALVYFILIFVFFSSSCNKHSSINDNEKEYNSMLDTIVSNNVQYAGLDDKKNKIENTRIETSEILPMGKKKVRLYWKSNAG